MNKPPTRLERIDYETLNSRQKENYNFQKASAVLADYGFVTLRLSDDWQGADSIAHHVSGDLSLKVQLKSRLTVAKKYENKDIWICFNYRYRSAWYLFLHDVFLRWALENLNIGSTKSWKGLGVYHWPSLSNDLLSWLSDYALTMEETLEHIRRTPDAHSIVH